MKNDKINIKAIDLHRLKKKNLIHSVLCGGGHDVEMISLQRLFRKCIILRGWYENLLNDKMSLQTLLFPKISFGLWVITV